MRKRSTIFLIAIGFIFCWTSAWAQSNSFVMMPLGVYGGSDEGNLSAYLLAPTGDTSYIALDAGTIYDGLKAAKKRHFFKKSGPDFLRRRVKGYLISHPHLDHVAGMIINSPEDSHKPIYGLPFCLKTLKSKYFTWSAWANFANEGEMPTLKKYKYQYLKKGEPTQLKGTRMTVTPYLLSHAVPGKSTAFLIAHKNRYFLYLGDTGADRIEQSQLLHNLWESIAPLVRSHQLKGISIECSYPDEQPDDHLYGHLKPALLMENLKLLDSLAGGTEDHPAIKDVPIIITHIKPAGANEATIKSELKKQNDLGVRLIFPKKGRKIAL